LLPSSGGGDARTNFLVDQPVWSSIQRLMAESTIDAVREQGHQMAYLRSSDDSGGVVVGQPAGKVLSLPARTARLTITTCGDPPQGPVAVAADFHHELAAFGRGGRAVACAVPRLVLLY
jgi:hypothetical protein